MRRIIVPLVFGFGGFAILVALAVWQVQRLAWKEALLAEMAARMQAPAAELPVEPEEAQDGFLTVALSGRFDGAALHVLTSTKAGGPGFRVVDGFEIAGGRRVLVDRGFVPETDKALTWPLGPMDLTGTLLWPNEVDGFTPAPNLERNIWFARDVPQMAEVLGTEPVLVVAASPTGTPSPRPIRVGVNLPNNHLQYAITWSLLAILWLAMTGYLLYRIRRDTIG